ncbi:MAG: anthranilate synthase component I family protein [Patescibacteria group bacterium]
MTKLPRIKFNNSKPTYLKFADDLDFFELFEKIEKSFATVFLLESLGEEEDRSRYSVMGFDPEEIISAKKNKLKIKNCKNGEEAIFQVENPYYALREIVPKDVISRKYAGGLIGYLAYDAMNYFEPSLKISLHEQFDQFKFGVYKDGLVYDKKTGEIFYFYYDENRIEILNKIKNQPNSKSKVSVKFLGNSKTQVEHEAMVERVKEDVVKGNIFQGVVGFKTNYEITGDKIAIYKKLREVNPSPHMYYFKFGEEYLLGASPELLFRLNGKEMETFPLAGTVKRGRDIQEDRELARNLLNDPKEIAEHSMLIDLHRNDIGRVAKFGTVKVKNIMDIKKYSHVQHISSEVSGIIRDDEDMFSALASNFPAGTLTGAPKIEAMKIIDREEGEPRGPYGGAVGHFGFNGECTFAIPIRSLFISGAKAYAQTAGGIVYDSEPTKEYQEIVNKLEAMRRVLENFEIKI